MADGLKGGIMSVTHSMFVPAHQRTAQHGLALADPPKEPQKLEEKHRPQRFADMLGQPYAVMKLQHFADFPHSHALLFTGTTGVGKSTAGRALAREMEINLEWNFLEIQSAKMDDEAVQTSLRMMRHVGIGNGWKMILVEEAHLMTVKARGLFLSILEDLSPKTVIIFTTTEPEKLGQAFIDRCEEVRFESNGRMLLPEGQAYLNRLWIAERLAGNPPNIEDCKGVILQNVISFRRIARFVESEMRKQASQPQAKPVITTSHHQQIRKGAML